MVYMACVWVIRQATYFLKWKNGDLGMQGSIKFLNLVLF